MPQADINGHQCNYVTYGNPGGIPLVFIHGFPFSLQMWAEQLPALSADIYALAYDLRGMGQSEATPGPYSMDLYLDDLAALLDYLHFEAPIICGLSMGGYLVLHAVTRDAGMFSGILLCDTRSGADSADARAGRTATAAEVRQTGMGDLVKAQLPNLVSVAGLTRDDFWVQELRHNMLATPPEGAAGALEAMRDRADTTAVLAKIKVPVQLIFGELDVITPPAEGRAMQALLPDSQLTIIEGAGHVSNLENIAMFNAALLGYLERFSGGRSTTTY